MLNAIFSPILNSSQPAFDFTVTNYPINFTVPDKIHSTDIKHIGIRVIKQNNNENIVKTDTYPDGIIYKNFNKVIIGNTSSIEISSNDDLKESWKAGEYYKIQLRFGKNTYEFGTDKTYKDFSAWKKAQIDNQAFSEWSTVMVIKAITHPEIKIANEENNNIIGIVFSEVENRESNQTPLFEGKYKVDIDEPVTHYRFQLYKDTKLLEDTGWRMHDFANDLLLSNKEMSSNTNEVTYSTSGDQHRFKQNLLYTFGEEAHTYSVIYSIRTKNLYEQSSDPYRFTVVRSDLGEWGSTFNLYAKPNNEEGLVEISIEEEGQEELILSGNYVLSRTSEKSNYQIWEDIKFFNWQAETFKGEKQIIFKDYTIESGIKYKYGFQDENIMKLRHERKIAKYKDMNNQIYDSMEIEVNFQYAYLYGQGIQLKLKYDSKMGSFKHTILAQKQDTLGSKYPIIMRNAVANYAEFPITGLISLHADEAQNFFQLYSKVDKEMGYYYKDELVIPARKLLSNYQRCGTENIDLANFEGYHIGTNLTDDNIFIERIYREKVEEFLNDGQPKLFKSPTSGNIIVGITNVTLTPNETLGQMIHSFNSTAYEVLENTYENLIKYKIETRGNFEKVLENESFYTFGQLNDVEISWKDEENKPINIIELIKQQVSKKEANSISNEFKFELKNLSSIWFEPFPEIMLLDDIEQVKGQIADYKIKEEPIPQELEELKERLEELWNRLITNNKPANANKRIGIKIGDNTPIYLGYNQKYRLDDLDRPIIKPDGKIEKFDWKEQTIEIIPIDGYYPPLLFNYIAEIELVQNYEEVITAVKYGMGWGQVNGIFLDPKDEKQSVYAETQAIMGNPMNFYNTLNISEIIDKQIKTQIGNAYTPNKEFFVNYDKEKHMYTDKNEKVFLYNLGCEGIDIEADEGTTFTITYSDVDNNGKLTDMKIVIGPTCHYILKYTLNSIREIVLDYPAHCSVNYFANVKIEEKGVPKV